MTISTISIYVSDLPAAVRFYVDVLGFRVEQSYGDDITKLDSDGPSLLLCAGAAPTPPAVRYPGGIVLGHRTLDLTKRIEELRGKGIRFVHERPERFPAGRYVAFTDPFGVVHELLEYATEPTTEE